MEEAAVAAISVGPPSPDAGWSWVFTVFCTVAPIWGFVTAMVAQLWPLALLLSGQLDAQTPRILGPGLLGNGALLSGFLVFLLWAASLLKLPARIANSPEFFVAIFTITWGGGPLGLIIVSTSYLRREPLLLSVGFFVLGALLIALGVVILREISRLRGPIIPRKSRL